MVKVKSYPYPICFEFDGATNPGQIRMKSSLSRFYLDEDLGDDQISSDSSPPAGDPILIRKTSKFRTPEASLIIGYYRLILGKPWNFIQFHDISWPSDFYDFHRECWACDGETQVDSEPGWAVAALAAQGSDIGCWADFPWEISYGFGDPSDKKQGNGLNGSNILYASTVADGFCFWFFRTPQKNPKDRYVKSYQASVWEVAVQKSFSLEVVFVAG